MSKLRPHLEQLSLQYFSICETPEGFVLKLHRTDKFNALNLKMGKELKNCLAALEVFVLETPQLETPPILWLESSTPQKNWIAGGDLTELSTFNSDDAYEYSEVFNTVCDCLERIPFLTISVIQGHAIGGGAELATSTDLRWIQIDSHFNFKQLTIGLPCGYGGSHRLAALIGMSAAKDILFNSQTLDAAKSLKLNLAHKVFTDEKHLLESKKSLAFKHRDTPARLIQAQKKLFQEGLSVSDRGRFFSDVWKNTKHQKSLNEFEKTRQLKSNFKKRSVFS